MAMTNPGIRIALVARTAADARDVMVEGQSGILSCSGADRPEYEPSKRRVTWFNGSMATTYSADKPDQLRGLAGIPGINCSLGCDLVTTRAVL
tara:strand:- start:43 stop:321 length:279 start_codon:yes stop_codon:yes gene_type:complete